MDTNCSIIFATIFWNSKLWVEDGHDSSATTKKQGYPSVCKTTGIAPKSTRVDPKCLFQWFFPGTSNYRAMTVSIGSLTCTNAFEKRQDRSQCFSDLISTFLLMSRQTLPTVLKTCTSGFQGLYHCFLNVFSFLKAPV